MGSIFYIFMILSIQQFLLFCQSLNNNINNQQKHFYSIRSKSLHVIKPLNSYQQLQLPLDRVFSLSVQNQNLYQSRSFIQFQPSSIKLVTQKQSTYLHLSLSNNSQISKLRQRSTALQILQDLRRPFPTQITQIIVLNQNVTFLYLFPSKMFVMQETSNMISVKNVYEIEDIKKQIENQSKQQLNFQQDMQFYLIFNRYVLGYLQKSKNMYLFDQKGYIFLDNEAKIQSLQHIHGYKKQSLQLITAQKQNGVKHVRINLKKQKIQLIRNIQFSDKDQNSNNNPSTDSKFQEKPKFNAYDISQDEQNKKIYILDNDRGLFQFQYSFNTQIKQYEVKNNQFKLIIEQKYCKAVDFLPNDRFVLICQNKAGTFFVQSYVNQVLQDSSKNPIANNRKDLNSEFKAKKTSKSSRLFNQSPVYHNCYFQDLFVSKQFYLTFQTNSIDIFWPSRFNLIPQMIHQKKNINLLGLQSFKIIQQQNSIYLYSIRNNRLIKQKVEQQEYIIKLGSRTNYKKDFILEVYGNCELLYKKITSRQSYSISFQNDQINRLNQYIVRSKIQGQNQFNNELCQIKIPIKFQASQYVMENKSGFSLAAGLLIICWAICLTLICICYKKYASLEQRARFTLLSLNQKQPKNINIK